MLEDRDAIEVGLLRALTHSPIEPSQECYHMLAIVLRKVRTIYKLMLQLLAKVLYRSFFNLNIVRLFYQGSNVNGVLVPILSKRRLTLIGSEPEEALLIMLLVSII